MIKGPLVVQIQSIKDIGSPKSKQYARGNANRMLALQITDGHTLCRAIEYQKTPQISLALAPGTKLRIQNVPLCAGTLLLSSETVSVVGGRVEKLYSTWKLKQVCCNEKALLLKRINFFWRMRKGERKLLIN